MFICDISIFNRYGKLLLDGMLSPLGVDWRELVVLLVIEQIPGIAQARLIPFLQTDKANVTKLLQLMEKKKLIRRASDGQDRRNKVCHLSDAGERLIPRLHEVLEDWEKACFAGIGRDDLQKFNEIGAIITQNLMKEWQE